MVFQRISIIHERLVDLGSGIPTPPPPSNFPTKSRDFHNIWTLKFQCLVSMALRVLESCESPHAWPMTSKDRLCHL